MRRFYKRISVSTQDHKCRVGFFSVSVQYISDCQDTDYACTVSLPLYNAEQTDTAQNSLWVILWVPESAQHRRSFNHNSNLKNVYFKCEFRYVCGMRTFASLIHCFVQRSFRKEQLHNELYYFFLTFEQVHHWLFIKEDLKVFKVCWRAFFLSDPE